MLSKPDLPNIDWNNKDVSHLVNVFSEKFDSMEKNKDATIKQQADEIKQQADEIKQLKE